MTTLPAERDLDTPAKVFPWAFRQLMKDLWVGGIPGIIESYDGTKRRAVVRPALEACFTDGSTVPRRAIANVPVIAPGCGGVTTTFCLTEGDAVWLAFSMRGMAKFKEEYVDEPATLTSFFSANDAVCFPGFGPPLTDANFAPSADEGHGFSSGVALQSNDGAVHVSVSENAVRVRAANDAQIDVADGEICLRLGTDTEVRLAAGRITLNAPNIEIENFTSGWPKDIENRLSAGGL